MQRKPIPRHRVRIQVLEHEYDPEKKKDRVVPDGTRSMVVWEATAQEVFDVVKPAVDAAIEGQSADYGLRERIQTVLGRWEEYRNVDESKPLQMTDTLLLYADICRALLGVPPRYGNPF